MTQRLETEAQEIEAVRALLAQEIERLENDGASIGAFSSALLLAASELYSEVWGSNELRAAFVKIAQAEQIISGSAGRA